MKYKLVCFDVDGTLIGGVEFSWTHLHNYFRVDLREREDWKERFYKGKITYLEWALHDIGMWIEKGAKKGDFLKAISVFSLMPGARETLTELKKKGVKLAIISGSLDFILEHFIPDYKEIFDDVFISRLIFGKDGKIKEVKATQYDQDRKADALRLVAKKHGFSLKECAFVGDHENDIEIMKIVGKGIAFDCKSDELRKIADVVVKKKDLREVLKHLS
ncbi:MAG TPA: HAD family phosphatase [Candidatus Nanoarchaeia archaeon]|nr:HAD family phosphatase [Candidatus Nanoarchaeia archaeon]